MQPVDRFALFQDGEPRVGVVIGTGPSLTAEQVTIARQYRTFGVNKAYEFDPDVLVGCNYQFWDYYWPELAGLRCHKWTTRPQLEGKYPGLNYIEERWEPGLSTDPSYICAHHGSGPQAVNIALHYGCEIILLIGWDMRHRGQRHYWDGGEYPDPMRHITRNLGPDGELLGLIAEMETIQPSDYGIEIYNCTPGSAMTCFPFRSISEFQSDSIALRA